MSTVTTTRIELDKPIVLTEPMCAPRVVYVDTEDYNLVVVYVEHHEREGEVPPTRLELHVTRPGTPVDPPLTFVGGTKTHLSRLWFVYAGERPA